MDIASRPSRPKQLSKGRHYRIDKARKRTWLYAIFGAWQSIRNARATQTGLLSLCRSRDPGILSGRDRKDIPSTWLSAR